MLTVIFPGQGAQIKGMGKHLYYSQQKLLQCASDIVGYSIEEVCQTGGKKLLETRYTQVALFTVNAMYYQQAKQQGLKANFSAGHSLGELNALHVAQVIDFECGVKIAHKRGELMSRAYKGGGMAAVIGHHRDKLQDIIDKYEQVYIANLNAPNQVVLSGEQKQLSLAQADIEAANISQYVPLSVSSAFHCPLMGSIKQPFMDFLSSIEFKKPKIPVLSNVTARFHSSQTIKENLVKQLTSTVRWDESIRFLYNKGPMMYVELGPKNTLSKLNKTILESLSHQVRTL